MEKRKFNRRKIKPAPKNCFFCKEKKEPSLAQIDVVRRFLTERGKIVSQERNGLCAKHQKAITKTIKQGRVLAMLPFVVR